MDLRQLRYFVTVARTGSVARAAEELNVSQSPLSRQIIQFEESLGFQLFERTKKRLVLSREGRTFLDGAAALLDSARQLDVLARDIAGGTTGRLRIGYVDGAVAAGLIGRIIDSMTDQEEQDVPGRFEFRPMRSRPQLEAVDQHIIDLGLAYSLPEKLPERLTARLIIDEPLALAVPAGTFVQDAQIDPAMLDGRPWIAHPAAMNPALRERFMEHCASSGFTPDIRYEAADQALVLRLVAAGRGFALLQASAGAERDAAVDFYPAPWFPMRVSLHALWRASDCGPLLKGALRLLDQPID
ncbi:MAG: LysR family transcriptional regulator [Rhizobiaceae bacterium]|nr:LysR family transcriptional regulator [Rhizobiaceae bacterium]